MSDETSSVAPQLHEDNLFTAARRVIRNIRIDDEKHGGLLSQQTIVANENLARHVDAEERRIKARFASAQSNGNKNDA